MKTIATILSVLGIFWAIVALPGLFAPIGITVSLIAKGKLSLEVRTLFLAFQALSGFFVWFFWIARAQQKKALLSYKAMWIVSTIHHSIWLLDLLRINISFGDEDSFAHGPFYINLLWVFSAFTLSILGIIKDKNTEQ